MNDTTVRCLPGLTEGVAAYVREVRGELADLPIEDVDDLTGGMEADLTELAAECGGDLAGRLGSPQLYAAELRSAAGLPEPAARSGRQHRPWGEALTHASASFTRLTEQHPWLRSVTAFLVTLRPAWWLLRGYLAAWVLWSMFGGDSNGIRPHSFLELVMAVTAIVVSVQIGRGWLRQRTLSRPLLVLANAIAVIAALVASGSGGGNHYVETYSPPPGVSLNGEAVGNIYGYDSAGTRISDVRLFDQDGRPLGGGDDIYDSNGNPMGVVRDSSGTALTNVYPRALVGSDPWQITDPANPQENPPVWTPPVSIVPLTSTATGTPTATAPAPTASVSAPTATTKPGPPKSAAPTPSSGPSPSVTRSGG